MQKLQLAFFRQIFRLRNSVSAPIVFAELAEPPWLRIWWSQVIGFMHRLAKMSSDSLHADILSDNINDALHGASSHNWAAGIQKHYAHLGLASPFSGGRLQNIDAHGFQRAMLAQEESVWRHFSPHCAPVGPSVTAPLITLCQPGAHMDQSPTGQRSCSGPLLSGFAHI